MLWDSHGEHRFLEGTELAKCEQREAFPFIFFFFFLSLPFWKLGSPIHGNFNCFHVLKKFFSLTFTGFYARRRRQTGSFVLRTEKAAGFLISHLPPCMSIYLIFLSFFILIDYYYLCHVVGVFFIYLFGFHRWRKKEL